MVNGKKIAYDESSMTHLENLHTIRAKAAGFIGSLDSAGQVFIAKELIDNTFDELSNIDYPGELKVVLFRDRKRNTYQILVADNGRGFPIGKFKDALTKLWFSGKHNQGAGGYDTSGGTYGIGGKVASALSKTFRAITMREGKLAVLDLRDSVEVNYKVSNVKSDRHGSWIMYEPNKTWKSAILKTQYVMHEIPYFAETGYIDLLNLLKTNDLFNDASMRLIFMVIDAPLSPVMFDVATPPLDVLKMFDGLTEKYNDCVVYDSDTASSTSKIDFLLSRLGVEGDPSWEFNGSGESRDGFLKYKMQLLLVKHARRPNNLVMVNSIVLKAKDNAPAIVTAQVLSKYIANRIADVELKKFFQNIYNLPIQMAIAVRYQNPTYHGTTKDNFKDKVFEENYRILLAELFNMLDDSFWNTLMSIVLPMVETAYATYFNKPMEQKGPRNLLLELNNPSSYTDCKTTDRRSAELFIVEGTSASHLKKVLDGDTQGLFATRGKPLNVLSMTTDRRVAFQRLSKDGIFADIVKITGITPSTDLTNGKINYGKLVITTDADADGAHIGALYVGNFHMLHPHLIESGMIYLATPPLFKMNLSRNKFLLIQDKLGLDKARIQYIYQKVFKISICNHHDGSIVPLSGRAFMDFCALVIRIGNTMANVSRQLNIPLLILERLVHGIDHLVPSINIKKLREVFPTKIQLSSDEEVSIRLQEHLNMMLVSIGEKDTPVSLMVLGEALQTQVLPQLLKVKYKQWTPILSTKLTDNLQERPTTLMQIYLAFQELNSDKVVRIDRLKGLGEAKVTDLAATITDKTSRVLHRITSIGDIQRVYALLGKDAEERKKMMQATGFLSSTMRR